MRLLYTFITLLIVFCTTLLVTPTIQAGPLPQDGQENVNSYRCQNGELPIDRTGRTIDTAIMDDLSVVEPFIVAQSDGIRLTDDVIERTEAIELDSNQWAISFIMTDEASDAMASYTASMIGQPMAIVIDGVVLSAPIIQSQIAGTGQITGDFTEEEAQSLADALTTASLPFSITLHSMNTVDGLQVIQLQADFLPSIVMPILQSRLNEAGFEQTVIGIINDYIIVVAPENDGSILPLLTTQGTLEFVDFSGINQDFVGRCILTDTQLELIEDFRSTSD